MSRRARLSASVALLLALMAPDAFAQGSRWELVGTDGGSVTALAVDRNQPQTVFAGGSEGSLFRSDDGGLRWRLLEPTLQLFGRRTSAIELAGDGTVYALHGAGLLWRSRDGGASWQNVSLRGPSSGGGLPGPLVTAAIGIPEASAGPIYASSTSGGIYRSDDGGSTWNPLDAFPAAAGGGLQQVGAIAVDPVNPDTLWAGTEAQGVYRSDDRGDSWQAASSGLSGSALTIRQLTTVPATPEALFAVTGAGVLRSTDGGASWQTTGALPSPVQAVVVDPAEPDTVWALAQHGRTYRSENGGGSWEWVAAAGRAGRALALSGAAVLVGTLDGLLRSEDAEGPYVDSIRGLQLRRARLVDANPVTSSLLAEVDRNLIVRSDDFGATWQPVQSFLSELSRSPVDPRVLNMTQGAALTRSLDDGATWSEPLRLPLNLDVRGSSGVWSSPEDPESLWAAGFEVALSGSVFSELWQSPDEGLSWTAVGPGSPAVVESLAPDRFDPSTLLAATPADRTVLRTRNGGGSWEPVVTGLPADPLVDELVADPVTVGRYLAWVAGAGLFETRNHGDSWRPLGSGLPAADRADLIFDPQAPSFAYLAIAGRGVYQSADGGSTWRALTGGIAPGRFIDPSISLGGGATRYLYAATVSGVARYLLTGEPCLAAADTLCLAGGRFEAKVAWQDFSSGSGVGRAHPLSDDTGAFWFFDSQNLEMAVKVLDGRDLNGFWWVFYGSLSNVPFTLRVRDTASGEVREYVNPPRTFASRGDTRGFRALEPRLGGSSSQLGVERRPPPTPLAAAGSSCGAALSALCLAEGRFRVEVEWEDFHGGTGVGQARGLTGDTGSFWFFHPDNLELLVKVLDGREVNGHWWVFYGSLSNVGFTLRVTDTQTGQVRTYRNPPRTFASRGDTAAF